MVTKEEIERAYKAYNHLSKSYVIDMLKEADNDFNGKHIEVGDKVICIFGSSLRRSVVKEILPVLDKNDNIINERYILGKYKKKFCSNQIIID